jgi:ABC-2 type transport system ATP-binding protein
MDIIIVKNLIKRFYNFIAVDDIGFSVPKGEIFAFLGQSGAGKSTTIKMLTTLLNPISGEILLNGYNSQINKDKVRKSFGIVF